MGVAEDYIELGLRLGRHIEGLVDAYYGPPEIAERVEAEEVVDPATLAADAERLRGESNSAWVEAQLVGLETVARRLAGEQIPYEDEVERCYGVRPRWTPEEVFEEAQRDLDDVLPGSGSLAERYQAWREDNVVPGELLFGVLDDFVEDLRARTRTTFGLPDGEAVELDEVRDKPWAAYNYYLGSLRSLIEINTDTSMSPDFVAELAAHEAYPGHHTEHAWKEQLLVREREDLLEPIILIGTPQSLVSEGIAGLGPEILLGEEEELVTAEHIAPTGVEYDPGLSRAVKRIRRPLEGVAGNAALVVHAQGGSADDARDYLMRWNLSSEARATHQATFLVDPLWRSYVTTYADGYRICRDFVDGDPERFKRLLTEQLTTADLI